MTIIVGIFDDARSLEQAIEQLADRGFEDTVFDEAIVAQEARGVGLLFAPGAGPTPGIAGSAGQPGEVDRPMIVRAFKEHLADYHVPDEVIESYATSFYHEGKVIIVKTDPRRAQEAMDILRRWRASRVDRHD